MESLKKLLWGERRNKPSGGESCVISKSKVIEREGINFSVKLVIEIIYLLSNCLIRFSPPTTNVSKQHKRKGLAD